MKTKNIFWAALSMTAALVMTACSSIDDMMTETPQAPSTSKIIPYTVTVNDGVTTRATVADDNKTLKFATGDKLYITGTNIKGVLTIDAGNGTTTGPGTASATFSGDLTYSGEGTPASDLSLTATLVSAQQANGTEVTINATTGAVTVNYPTTAYCADVATAVQKYSNLTGTSTYGAKSFTLAQQTAFLNFVITFEDGTATATSLTAVVKNGDTQMASASVTTTTESEKVVAKFVLPVASNTALSSATVKMGDKVALDITDATLTGKVYNVKKTKVTASKALTAVTASEVGWRIGSDSKAYEPTGALPTGVTAVAMIAYVSGTGQGLALALEDVSSNTLTWNNLGTNNGGKTAAELCSAWNTSKAVTGGSWRLPSIKDWQYMFIGCGASGSYSDTPSSMSFSELATKLTAAGGTALRTNNNTYWSSTEHNPGSLAWKLVFGGSHADFGLDGFENSYCYVRACLEFGPFATVTAADLGKVIGADGKIYANAAAATAASTTAVAIITYVGSDNGEADPYNHGLALALSDANEGTGCEWKTTLTDAGHTKQTDKNNFTSESGLQYNSFSDHNTNTYPAFKAAIANNGTAAPTGCSEWFLASAYQWTKMLGTGGYGLTNLITTAGGYTGLVSGDDYYWSSSENNADYAWHLQIQTPPLWDNVNKGNTRLVRSCLAF